MGSMNNNWLGFSFSPQELQDHSQNSILFNSEEISTAQIPGDNHLTSHDSANINLGILEAFNRNTHSQDWNMNSSQQNLDNNYQERPKLENFLGVSFDQLQEHKKNINCNPILSDYSANNSQLNVSDNSYNIYQETEVTNTNNNGTIGISMIKNWLRSNPVGGDTTAPPSQAEVAGARTLSLSMSTGSQSSKEGQSGGAIESVARKSAGTFGQRTSIYRGVTRHRWTGRYEAHLWDNSCRREGQARKGRQVYLGGYDKEEKAARSYDLAALKYWGTTITTNLPISNYEKEMEEMKHMTRQEYIASLRRKSSGFSRGASIYRGVTRHHQHGRWQARIGRVAGNKDLYLGTFSTQEEAAEAYDVAAIKFRGLNAVTNFEMNRYDVKTILESSNLPIGAAAKRLKDAEMVLEMHRANERNLINLHPTDKHIINGFNTEPSHGWFQQSQPLITYPNIHQRLWCKQEQDHGFNEVNQQLQLGNTHNFLDSNALFYGNGSFVIPMNQEQENGYEGLFGSSRDAYYQQQRNLYYQSQQSLSSSSSSSNGLAKGNFYDDHEGSNCNNNWMPSGVPTLAAANSTFTVWNDTCNRQLQED